MCEWTYQVALSGPNHPGSPSGSSNSMPRKNFARMFASNKPVSQLPTHWDVDELLGELYDEVAADLAGVVGAAIDRAGRSVRSRTAAGIRAVLGHAGDDPRRGAILFTHARANPVLAARRVATEELLMSSVLAETVRLHQDRTSRPVADQVGAVMFAGAMAELARQWLGGHLESDLDVVVDGATTFVLRSAPART
ncbi:hypothetical protein [Gordonia polyisoprenivorans]|uniref:hypothetical protein n=1 Tax=Gordonia polyisoprenivorans TaxID=84595 RepID=UPI00230092AB|nr:hypothetical protein [Gordonia polyisoprenivorans]WCB35823.1 hypothetical protein PHA63_17150 [Gordonia polyisoprenivorans]